VRIGVVADTHAPRYSLPSILHRAFARVDLIVHAGDLCTESVLDELGATAPVSAVAGNMDARDLAMRLPEHLKLTFGDRAVVLIHGHQAGTALQAARREARRLSPGDCVIFGHSHQAYNRSENGVLLFNPGSPTWKRSAPARTYGFLDVSSVIRGTIRQVED